MSIKSYKSKIIKTVACVIAAAISLGATTYSGNKSMKIVPPDSDVIKNVDTELVMSLAFADSDAIGTSLNNINLVTTCTTTTVTTTATTETTTVETTDIVTSTPPVVMTVDEASTEEDVEVSVEDETTDFPREYVVYKPSTHYVHRNTCHWFNDECVEIESAEGLKSRKCTECNPDIEIMDEYVEEVPVCASPIDEPVTEEPTFTDTEIKVTDYEYIILCNLVAGEYGSDWVSVYDKGAVVATVIHRLWEGTRWTSGMEPSIYNVIAAPGQYDGKYLSGSYSQYVTASCKEAVTYALNNISAYDYYANPDGTAVYMVNSFSGDGRNNWFRHS